MEKVNGLSSASKFWEKVEKNGDVIQYHEHPVTGELVVLRTWFVDGGDGDVMPEFSLVGVSRPIVCQISKSMALCQQKVSQLNFA